MRRASPMRWQRHNKSTYASRICCPAALPRSNPCSSLRASTMRARRPLPEVPFPSEF
ncbi:hypothetical protein DFH09DRAFT_1353761 [Mycena vulgaris]|nr:hypothetical protein DFH09DRAFT_1353761 [Mycena vulgaris]